MESDPLFDVKQDPEECSLNVQGSYENPWSVQSIYHFQYFNCPTCHFKDVEKETFVNHAIQVHPESIEMLFKIKDGSMNDVKDLLVFHQIGVASDNDEDFNDNFEEDEESSANASLDPQEANLHCVHCQCPFTKLSDLITHLSEHHDNKCNLCKEALNSRHDLKEHIDTVHCKGNLVPSANHPVLSSEVRPILPKEVLCTPDMPMQIKSERNDFYPMRDIYGSSSSSSVSSFNCTICGATFDKKSLLNAHLKKSHNLADETDITVHECNECDKKFLGKLNFKKHKLDAHPKQKKTSKVHKKDSTEPSESGLGPAKKLCVKCNKSIGAKYYTRHLAYVHGDQSVASHKCEKCGKSFVTQTELHNHEDAVHERIKKYKCDMCDKAYFSSTNLDFHKRSFHTKEKRFFCKLCENKGFFFKSSLDKHMDGFHLNKRDSHMCYICGKGCTQAAQLKRHIEMVHEKKKQVQCDLCGMEFYSQSMLSNHIKAVHEKRRNFFCEPCNKSFYKKQQLKAHLKTMIHNQTKS